MIFSVWGKGSKNGLLQSVLVGRRELSWGRVGIPTSFFYRRGMHIAQGDSPSPLLYNFVGQILLFKIELNPRIIDSFKTFHDKFASTGKNFTLLPIYCNHLFGHGRNMQNKFDNVFFLTRLKTDF